MIIAQQSSEMAIASYLSDPSTGGNRLMDIVCERENMCRALQRVRSNKWLDYEAPTVNSLETVEEPENPCPRTCEAGHISSSSSHNG
jgi:hypothetical protein